MKVHPTTMRKAYEGAALYAASDKSDPFALARAQTHIRTGLAFNQTGEPLYAATQTTERRTTPDGNEYDATVYRDIKRP